MTSLLDTLLKDTLSTNMVNKLLLQHRFQLLLQHLFQLPTQKVILKKFTQQENKAGKKNGLKTLKTRQLLLRDTNGGKNNLNQIMTGNGGKIKNKEKLKLKNKKMRKKLKMKISGNKKKRKKKNQKLNRKKKIMNSFNQL